jgi:hypothetical protein
MNRTRTGRGAPPWAWMQTGPLTVDVEACMSNRDRERLAAEATARIRASSHNEAAFPERVAQSPENVAPANANESTPVAEATEHAPTERFATVKLVYTGPGSSPESERIPASAPELESPTEKSGNLIDQLPAFKAAMRSLEKRRMPVVTTPAAGSAAKRPRSKAKPTKRKRKPATTRITLRPSAPRKQPRARTQDEIDLSRHKRRCGVCHDPGREAIEEAFLQWRNVECIDSEFEPEGGRSAIYRHAHALNLFRKRSLNLRSALEYIIEESERISPTAEGIVKAMRAYTRINDVGEWIDTPTTHIVQVIAMPAADPRNPANPIQGLSLDVRKERSQIIESGIRQPLLTETAPHSEIAVTD